MPSVLDLMFVFRPNDGASREVTATRREAGGPVVVGGIFGYKRRLEASIVSQALYVLSPTAAVLSLARSRASC